MRNEEVKGQLSIYDVLADEDKGDIPLNSMERELRDFFPILTWAAFITLALIFLSLPVYLLFFK